MCVIIGVGNKNYKIQRLLRNSRGPMATSPELCASKNVLRCCQTLGNHPKIAANSGCGPCSSSKVISRLLRTLPKSPLAGSMCGATNTQRKPCCNCKLVAEHADCAIVPNIYENKRQIRSKSIILCEEANLISKEDF